MIGGVSGGVGGSLYLTGVEDSIVSDNVFWRPGAAHMYLEDLTDVEFADNFFLQGLHADGANQDGLFNELVTPDNWGYAGFETGGPDGYGPDLEQIEELKDQTYYGRNYVAEIKGVTDGVVFDGNTAKFNSGGIQFWDEDNASNYFLNTEITNNVFTDFINAEVEFWWPRFTYYIEKTQGINVSKYIFGTEILDNHQIKLKKLLM